MQRTRLNTIVNQATLQFRQWVFNPWRRLSVIVISLLFGNFFATAISATAGQAAKLDVTISAILVIFVETVSWVYYRFAPKQRRDRALDTVPTDAALAAFNADPSLSRSTDQASGQRFDQTLDLGPVRSRSTLAESLNAFKLGMIYGLFVEAFKLGS